MVWHEVVAVKLVSCPEDKVRVPELVKSPPTERGFTPIERVLEACIVMSPSGLEELAEG